MKQTTAEKILQRRRQVLIHSIIYYRLDASYVPDAIYDRWAHELVELQKFHPEVSESIPYHLDAFRDFTGDTGFDLPLHDMVAIQTAMKLLQMQNGPRIEITRATPAG